MPTAYGTETIGLHLFVYFRTSSMISRYVNTGQAAQRLDMCNNNASLTFRTASFDCLAVTCIVRLDLSSAQDFNCASQVVYEHRLEFASTSTEDGHDGKDLRELGESLLKRSDGPKTSRAAATHGEKAVPLPKQDTRPYNRRIVADIQDRVFS